LTISRISLWPFPAIWISFFPPLSDIRRFDWFCGCLSVNRDHRGEIGCDTAVLFRSCYELILAWTIMSLDFFFWLLLSETSLTLIVRSSSSIRTKNINLTEQGIVHIASTCRKVCD
jgi:hypothetical protein